MSQSNVENVSNSQPTNPTKSFNHASEMNQFPFWVGHMIYLTNKAQSNVDPKLYAKMLELEIFAKRKQE